MGKTTLGETKSDQIFLHPSVQGSHLIFLKENTQHSQLRFSFKDSSHARDMLWVKLISWFGLTKEEPKACCSFPFCRPMTVWRQEGSSTGLLCHDEQRIWFNSTLQILQLSNSSEGLHLGLLIMKFYSSRSKPEPPSALGLWFINTKQID